MHIYLFINLFIFKLTIKMVVLWSYTHRCRHVAEKPGTTLVHSIHRDKVNLSSLPAAGQGCRQSGSAVSEASLDRLRACHRDQVEHKNKINYHRKKEDPAGGVCHLRLDEGAACLLNRKARCPLPRSLQKVCLRRLVHPFAALQVESG